MRQGITTRYLGPTNSRGARIKAIARKADSWGKEMSLTVPYDYAGSTSSRHTQAAQLLATKLGWSGLWIGGGKPEEDGYMYVNLGAFRERMDKGEYEWTVADFGKEGEDWFYVPAEVKP